MSGPGADPANQRGGCSPLHFDDMNRRPRPTPGQPLARPPLSPALTLCLGILLVNGAVALWLLLLGRSLLPTGVPLQWWSGSTFADHNSQHLTDYYSALHVISGAGLYFAARRVCPLWPLHKRLLMVIACSGVWEVVENTPWIIALFNDPGGPGVYRGDSIVNAFSDTAFVALGFIVAHHMPRWFIIGAGLMAEIGVAVVIHDGFVLGTARIILR